MSADQELRRWQKTHFGASGCFIGPVAAVGVSSVAAQDFPHGYDWYTEAQRMTRAGQFAGCTLNYRAVIQDFAYRKGALVAASGSFNLNLITSGDQRIVGPLLKLGVLQMIPQTSGEPEAPAFAYLESASGSTAAP